MNVYVESNFVLEQALEQEQFESCEQLVRMASAGSIRLIIPAFSLAEPHDALLRKEKARSKLSNELQVHLSELGRSRPYRDATGDFSELAAALVISGERGREGLQRPIAAMLETAHVIPLDSAILVRAGEIQVGVGMSAQDSFVLASILSHLGEIRPANSCFLNRNTKDFDDPTVRGMLDVFRCKFFGQFDDGLRYIEASLRTEDR